MRRGAKPAKAKVETKSSIARKARKSKASRVNDLEKHLAEALKREAEALEQQTATSEILRVISSSATELGPVLDTVAANAARVCDAEDIGVFQLDGDRFRAGGRYGTGPKQDIGSIARIRRDLLLGRTFLERRTIHVHDMAAELESEYPGMRNTVERFGMRTMLCTPLLSGGKAVGVIVAVRYEVRPFTDKQIKLLETFADQAVIAIENVRLFTELEARNRDLTESLERETATGEILRVISSSPTDIQPVLVAILDSGRRLCDAEFGAIFRFEDGVFVNAVSTTVTSEFGAWLQKSPIQPGPGTPLRRVGMERRPVQVADILSDPDFAPPDEYRREGMRTALAVPMLKDGALLGALTFHRRSVKAFTDQQIALLETFAAQAVIAIENVRLFKELEERNSALTQAHAQVSETLDQQTATAEILRVIGTSPTDAQPVFEAIARSGVQVCGALSCAVFVVDGEMLRLAATHGVPTARIERFRSQFPAPLTSPEDATRTVRERSIFHLADIENHPAATPGQIEVARLGGYRTRLMVPMVREDSALGLIAVTREAPTPFPDRQVELLKTFADQAVIAIENVRLFTELQEKNRALTQAHSQVAEALEQQTATAEILRVIASSPTDARPVFDAIVMSAVRLCGGVYGAVYRRFGDMVDCVALYGLDPDEQEFVRRAFPRPVMAGRSRHFQSALVEGAVVSIVDIAAEPDVSPQTRDFYLRHGGRSVVLVPLVRQSEVLGVLGVGHRQIGAFSASQVDLLKTFAAQAVIAIENARLFTELEEKNRALTDAHAQVTEALDQQTAAAEVLRVIGSSPTDAQPVFEAIVSSARRLLGGFGGAVYRVAGNELHLAAYISTSPSGDAALRSSFPRPLAVFSPPGEAIRRRAPVVLIDIETDGWVPDDIRELIRRRGDRSGVWVPMMREGMVLGAIGVTRSEPGSYGDEQIALLRTFADQAVIAIENVRLFTELQEKNRALSTAHAQVSEALEQQTATAEILRVISRSPTDVQPVFDTIVRSAVRLCAGLFSALFQFDGELIHHVAYHNYTPEALEAVRRMYPMRPTRALLSGRTILSRAIVHIPDVEVDPEYQYQAMPRAIGWRSGLFVPMLREGAPIGVIMVARAEPGPFSDNDIELLKTFADQAVIAVENVRLFKELRVRTGELTQSVEKLTALGEVSQAVSSTLDVETVLDTIVSRASQLAGAAGCSIYEYDEGAERFELRAMHNYDAEFVGALRAVPLRKGEGLMGRATEMREPIQIPDITQPGAYESSVRDTLIRFGYRALLSVPLLREDQIIGSLSFNRKAPGEFPPEVVDVLKTFATQSALAIQNARLFREIADKSAQLEAASRHKSEFLANMSHELRTPLNAIIGFSEVLAEGMFGEINEKQTEYLQDILESGRHLLSLINDILDLSKIEAGRMELEQSDFHLPSAIENALILVRERASRRGIKLGSTIDERLGVISGDERKVKQVLLNLLSNALKFTPEGGRIDVGARLHDGVAEVSVADTGIGIAPADLEAVFEEFRQVGAADKKAEGTGLGLALSRKFIELHGGRIWVESEAGKGSTFRFTLPSS